MHNRLELSGISTSIKIVRVFSFLGSYRLLPESVHTDGKPKFATQDIVLGTLYIVACVIDVFGVAAAAMVRCTTASIVVRY